MKIIIGTHHKSGTNFFVRFIEALASELDVAIWNRHSSKESQRQPQYWDIYFDRWSKWLINIDSMEFRGIHSIRHPCSLIYSATLYHLRSSEKWLHAPNDKFNGLSYSEELHGKSAFEDQLIFEMSNHSFQVLNDMRNVASDKRFYDVRLENISHDEEMTDLSKAFEFCGVGGMQKKDWLSIASRYCLWNLNQMPRHSTGGVSNDWQKYFRGGVLEEFRKRFGSMDEELGYEPWSGKG